MRIPQVALTLTSIDWNPAVTRLQDGPERFLIEHGFGAQHEHLVKRRHGAQGGLGGQVQCASYNINFVFLRQVTISEA